MFNFGKNGVIKVRIFAFILLVISCCLVLSALKSIKREFKGRVIFKETSGQIFASLYDLYIIPEKASDTGELSEFKNVKTVSGKRFSKPPFNLNVKNVGVSAMVFENADFMCKIRKNKYSPFVYVNEVKFFDKSLFWIIWAMICTIMALVIYFQTLKPKQNQKDYETEELYQ